MKKVSKDKILNISNIDKNKFLFNYLSNWENKTNNTTKIIFLSDLLENRKNSDMLIKAKEKPAIYSNVYSPKDELEIFKDIFDNAIKNNEKIHIIGVTLKEELDIIEKYYTTLGFKREDINCFDVNFKKPLITISVKIENLMWKGSDYKKMGKTIFFNPPIRESGHVKAMFKGINKGIISNIYFKGLNNEYKNFLERCILEELILSLSLSKLIKYNLEQIGFKGEDNELIISY